MGRKSNGLKRYTDIPLFVNGERVRRKRRVAWGITLGYAEIAELEKRYGSKNKGSRRCERHRKSTLRDAFGRRTTKCHDCREDEALKVLAGVSS